MASLVDQNLNELYQESGNGLYIVKIVRHAHGKTEIVNGWASKEDFVMGFSSEFSGISFGNKLDTWAKRFNGFMSSTGVQFNNQFMTAKLYQGTASPDFQINMTFFAYKDSYKDVIVPTTQLLRLVLPEQINSFMVAVPGPTAVGQFTNMIAPLVGKALQYNQEIVDKSADTGEVIGISIGKWLRVAPIVVKQAIVSIPPQYDIKGNPIKVTINLTISPFYTPFKNQFQLPGDSMSQDSSPPTVFNYGFRT